MGFSVGVRGGTPRNDELHMHRREHERTHELNLRVCVPGIVAACHDVGGKSDTQTRTSFAGRIWCFGRLACVI